jgi:hypothetical protein
MTDNDDPAEPSYEVGYRKPPKHSRFPKGTSGNPKGRGKGVRNFRTEIESELNSRILITENGKRKRVSKRAAVAKQLVNKAASGDPKAIPTLLNESRFYEADSHIAGSASVSEPDQSVIDDIVRRIRATAVQPASESAPSEHSAPCSPTTTDESDKGGS